ncbi:MAG: hypothetical protein ACLTSX_02760 [Collinsella sp.]
MNMTGVLRVRTTKPFGESTVSRILSSWRTRARRRPRTGELHHALRPRLHPRRHVGGRRARRHPAARRYGRVVRLDLARPDRSWW